MSALPPRRRARALAAGRAEGIRLAVPLALRVAARIKARPLDRFLTDPTQLANGLLELFEATGADGIVCALGDGMEREALGDGPFEPARALAGARISAALEAARRLRATAGDRAALVAGLTGPATLAAQCRLGEGGLALAGPVVAQLARAFCEAGCDVILVRESEPAGDPEAWGREMRTLANIVRFHRALPCATGGPEGPGAPVLPSPTRLPFDGPGGGEGLVVTVEEVPVDADIARIRAWVGA